MATLQEIKARADQVLTQIWREIQERQVVYAANHGGRYFQGLITHTVTPADGVDVAPDCLLVTPTDQPERWIDFGLELPAIPFSIQLDVYDGPLGKGYVVTVQVKYQGVLYERAAQYGPETHRAFSWREVTGVEDGLL